MYKKHSCTSHKRLLGPVLGGEISLQENDGVDRPDHFVNFAKKPTNFYRGIWQEAKHVSACLVELRRQETIINLWNSLIVNQVFERKSNSMTAER